MYSRETDDRRYRMSNSNVSHNNGGDDAAKMVIAHCRRCNEKIGTMSKCTNAPNVFDISNICLSAPSHGTWCRFWICRRMDWNEPFDVISHMRGIVLTHLLRWFYLLLNGACCVEIQIWGFPLFTGIIMIPASPLCTFISSSHSTIWFHSVNFEMSAQKEKKNTIVLVHERIA